MPLPKLPHIPLRPREPDIKLELHEQCPHNHGNEMVVGKRHELVIAFPYRHFAYSEAGLDGSAITKMIEELTRLRATQLAGRCEVAIRLPADDLTMRYPDPNAFPKFF